MGPWRRIASVQEQEDKKHNFIWCHACVITSPCSRSFKNSCLPADLYILPQTLIMTPPTSCLFRVSFHPVSSYWDHRQHLAVLFAKSLATPPLCFPPARSLAAFSSSCLESLCHLSKYAALRDCVRTGAPLLRAQAKTEAGCA